MLLPTRSASSSILPISDFRRFRIAFLARHWCVECSVRCDEQGIYSRDLPLWSLCWLSRWYLCGPCTTSHFFWVCYLLQVSHCGCPFGAPKDHPTGRHIYATLIGSAVLLNFYLYGAGIIHISNPGSDPIVICLRHQLFVVGPVPLFG